MALPLPSVQSIPDCTLFSRTVLPYLSQLQTLPARLNETRGDLDSLKEVYLATNPLVTAIAFCLLFAALAFLTSEISGNYSQVDRFWSILPPIYSGHFALWARMAGVQSQFLDTIAINTFIWGARLTYNYWRKGGYKYGSEDYRWKFVRSKINNRFLFFIFNIVFISLMQSALLLLINTPAYTFLLLSRRPDAEPFMLSDVAFSRLTFFFIVLEHFADQQQWQFHRAKHMYHQSARISDKQFSPDDLERGFIVNGLWSLMRHPNFAAEQAIWLSLYAWLCFRTQTYFQWTGIGVLGYLLIFQGSTCLTESISASKYPEYSDYKARVGRFIPRLSVEPRAARAKASKSPKQTGRQDEGKKQD